MLDSIFNFLKYFKAFGWPQIVGTEDKGDEENILKAYIDISSFENVFIYSFSVHVGNSIV